MVETNTSAMTFKLLILIPISVRCCLLDVGTSSRSSERNSPIARGETNTSVVTEDDIIAADRERSLAPAPLRATNGDRSVSHVEAESLRGC